MRLKLGVTRAGLMGLHDYRNNIVGIANYKDLSYQEDHEMRKNCSSIHEQTGLFIGAKLGLIPARRPEETGTKYLNVEKIFNAIT